MADKAPTSTHQGIEIVYRESDNRWVFTLRGRERSAESLANAKAAIDKPEPKKKSDKFTPVEAWFDGHRWGGRGEWKKVTVTSIAESYVRVSDCGDVWIKDGKERSKQSADRIYPVGEANDAIIEQLRNLDKEKADLEERIAATKDKLKPFIVPKDEE